MSDADARSHRKTYGRGFHDGQRLAFQLIDTMKTESQAAQLLQQQTVQAQKVFACVPKQESWSVDMISGEVRRSGRNVAIDALAGCLETLRRVGLIVESHRGYFRVAPTKADPEIVAAPAPAPVLASVPPPAPAKPASSPIETLGLLAERARSIAVDLKALAGEIETAALNLQSSFETQEAKVDAARQLKALLEKI